MEALLDCVYEFVRVRQLNFAVAGLLTVIYIIYQYWSVFRDKSVDELDSDCVYTHKPRSRSRSHNNRQCNHKVDKRRKYGKCPECSKCTKVDSTK